MNLKASRAGLAKWRNWLGLLLIQLLAFGLASPAPTYADERELGEVSGTPTNRPDHRDSYYGLYRISSDHMIGIDRFTPDAGESWILMSDYQSGTVRRLFPVSETEFEMGPGFNVSAPPELKLRFTTDVNGNVAGVSLSPPDGAVAFAEKVPVQEQQVTFADGTVNLAGTLLVPATKGPHPAIILLHGSGPLTRSSFGPYPHFFTSLGLAVLIYDKRGTGDSSGTHVDASHPAALAQSPTWFYPDGLADDARAALRFLRGRNDIDPRQIGLWGSSEGGMLATYVASQNKDIAFAINSSGFTGALWQTVYYQAGAKQRESGVPQSQVDEALAYTKLWLGVARTGEGYDRFIEARDEARKDKKPWASWSSAEFTSLEQMRWHWAHLLSFSPLPALKGVSCPVLGLWGQLDTSTEALIAERNMRAVLREAGNKDVTLKIFPNAGWHGVRQPAAISINSTQLHDSASRRSHLTL